MILAIKEHGVVSIAGNDFPVKFSDTDLGSVRAKEYQDLLVGYRKAQEFLDAMHVKKELDFDSCTDEDIEKLILPSTIPPLPSVTLSALCLEQ